MRAKVEQILGAKIDSQLVGPLLDAYFEMKEHYYLAKHRPAELEGGRFCEVAIRCLQLLGNGEFTPLSKKLGRFDDEANSLETAGGGQAHESIRIHGPRLLLAIYGIRNRRDVGHVGGDVNPNLADATLLMTVCDWVLAELVRITYDCSLTEAQALVDGLVKRRVPLVEDFDGVLKVLDPKLSIGDKIVAMLYAKADEGATVGEINTWLKPAKRGSVAVALFRLEHGKAYIHRTDGRCKITRVGIKYAEENLLSKTAT